MDFNNLERFDEFPVIEEYSEIEWFILYLNVYVIVLLFLTNIDFHNLAMRKFRKILYGVISCNSMNLVL